MSTTLLTHPRYASGALLGEGAEGVVLRVVDREAPARALVAKVMRPRTLERGTSAPSHSDAGLAGEFALLARLRIPGLVRAHDFAHDTATGAPFFVEDFVDGLDAPAWVNEAKDARGRGARLARLLGEMTSTLAALHDAGFLHGDLKPAHVRMAPGGRATLLDLGAAVARDAPREASGLTRAFAAPERLAGAAASASSDLYGVGAVAWAAAVGRAPEPAASRRALRDEAPWVVPSVADVIERLLAPHPEDRPRDAREVLAMLGHAQTGAASETTARPMPNAIGRERDLALLLGSSEASVRYVVGASGVGKSHLLRELVTSSLLAGRETRTVQFPCDDERVVSHLVAFFRGLEDAWPFGSASGRGPVLLALDDLHRAPQDLVNALNAFRCRVRSERPHGSGANGAMSDRVRVVASARSAPAGAETVALGALSAEAFATLCNRLGIEGAGEIARASRESACNPGWLLASAGRVPLTADAALERARTLSDAATEVLAVIAVAGGATSAETCRAATRDAFGDASWSGTVAELLAASLVDRARGGILTLTSPNLAGDLAAALGTFERTDRLAAGLLASARPSASALLAVAGAPHVPARRTELFVRAAARAKEEGLRAEELEALLALAADPHERTVPRLRRLERLTRDAGNANAHPQVLDWLDAAAAGDREVAPLALRRRAEKAARDGSSELARSLADQACAAAHALGDRAGEAFALATRGAVALYRASWEEADLTLTEARSMLLTLDQSDPEELARLDHNLGVVALYRGRVDDANAAFERSLAIKRRLGDQSGVRSCLLNLGLARTKASRFGDADSALAEATELARSLGQTAGLGWCLAARAELEVRRGDARAAERWIAEADAFGEAIPAAVRADLALLRAEVFILEGDGRGARGALLALEEDARRSDRLVDARALVLESRAHLASLPANRREAARRAIAGARMARTHALAEVEEQALAALAAARAPARMRYASPMEKRGPNAAAADPLWDWIARLTQDIAPAEAATLLARLIVADSGGERAFVAFLRADATVAAAWGADLDGLPIADAAQRIPVSDAAAAMRKDGAIYQREIETPAGVGSRLAAAAGGGDERAVVIVEHRFAPGRFDSVDAATVGRWVTLAALLGRLRSTESPDARLRGDEGGHGAHTAEGMAPKDLAALPQRGALSTSFPMNEPRRKFPAILGESAPLKRALARIDAAIDSDLPVLILGETGSGKELVARAIHDLGPRARSPFVAVNCASIPDTLFEAELFGHARGSFTGADRARAGLLARAEGGTILLDEIGELPMPRQATLLRALETRRYRSVGSDDERPFNARVLAATNRDLEGGVREGTFRQDLLFRLQVLEVRMPPLRERPDDIPLLARHFLAAAGEGAELSKGALAALSSYAWPGNVRELEHQMQRLGALGVKRIDVEHLAREIRAPGAAVARIKPRAGDATSEREDVARALAATGGNISHAATRLGLTRHGLKKRMLRLGMRTPASSLETSEK